MNTSVDASTAGTTRGSAPTTEIREGWTLGSERVLRSDSRIPGMATSAASTYRPPVGTDLSTTRGGKRPPPPQTTGYLEFRRICDAVLTEIGQLQELLAGDQLIGDWFGPVVEIEALLEKLYDTPWGEAEALKRIVVSIQAQINNSPLDGRHVRFLTEVFRNLRVRYLIDSIAVDEVQHAVKRHGLDLFRGTVSEPVVRKRYMIVEDTGP